MKKIFYITYIIVILLVFYSTFVSGFNYIFDDDEFFHTQVAFLLSRGLTPYKDFFMIFSPIFHLLIIPVITIIGANFNALLFTRLLMIGLYVIRILACFILVKKLFGKKAAIIFLPLIMFDPVTTFVGMQIRPDNLSLTLVAISLLLLTYKSKTSQFFCGITLGTSFLILFKTLPIVASIVLVSCYFSLKKKELSSIFYLLTGMASTILLFLSAFVINGSFLDMFRHTVFLPQILTKTIKNSTPPGFLFMPDNFYIFGLYGKPLTWILTHTLPVLAGLGIYSAVSKKIAPVIKWSLVLSYALSFITLLEIPSVFSQYYLPLNLLGIILASSAINDLISMIPSEIEKKAIYLVLMIAFMSFSATTYKANFERSSYSFRENIKSITPRQSKIPANAYVFPNFLFHPSAYPLVVGSNLADYPKSITDAFPAVDKTLEEKKVGYLILTEADLSYFPAQTVKYIYAKYQQTPTDSALWIRK